MGFSSKKLEKYFSQFTDKELEDNFSELVRRYNEKEKSEQRNVESAFFYPIKVGSSVISESNFQDYKNDIIRRLNKGIEIQNIRDFYQKKVIDKFLSDKRFFEIYEKIKVGEPIKNPLFSNIVKKWSFWSNVHRVQDIIELEAFFESQIQVNNTPTTKKQEYSANEFALVYIFDLYAKGKRIPINEIEGGLAKKVIESNTPKNCTVKPNSFYKAVKDINRDFDVNKKRDLENISKRWKEVLKELSSDWKTLKSYLTEKKLM